jgi:hypothetical protein
MSANLTIGWSMRSLQIVSWTYPLEAKAETWNWFMRCCPTPVESFPALKTYHAWNFEVE